MKFIINKDTFLWKNTDIALFYNSKTFRYKRVKLNDKFIVKFIDDLLCAENFRVAVVPRDLIGMVSDIAKENFGKIISDTSKEFQLPKNVQLNKDIDHIPERNRVQQLINGRDVSKYLNTVTFYVGGKCEKNDWYKQLLYPINSEIVLDFDELTKFVQEIYDINDNVKYNIVVSEPEFYFKDTCLTNLTFASSLTTFVFRWSVKNEEIARHITSFSFNVKMIIEPWMDIDPWFDKSFPYIFIVKSENDMDSYIRILKNNDIMVNISCILNENETFFRKEVFVTKKDILNSRITKKIIYAHQKINTFNWGKFYILPTGKVYSSTDFEDNKCLGYISESPTNLIIEELVHNFSWRQIRDCDECSKCICRWLCPSPTIYEKLLGMNTICDKNSAEYII